MNLQELLADIYRNGIRLVISDDQLRARAPKGAITPEMKLLLAEHKAGIVEALSEGTFPDETLPQEIFIPAHVPNDVDSIRACIDMQRVARRVA